MRACSSSRCSTASPWPRSTSSWPVASPSCSGSCATSTSRTAPSTCLAATSASSPRSSPAPGCWRWPRGSRRRRWWAWPCRYRSSASCRVRTGADDGHARSVDRHRRHPHVGHRRPGPPDVAAAGARRTAARTAGNPRLLDVSAVAAADRHRDRRGALAVPQPHAGRHDDPRRCRRPRDARGRRRQRQPGLRHDLRDRRRPGRSGRRHRGRRAVDGARRGYAAAARLARGGDRGWHGQRRRGGDGRRDSRPRRDIRTGLRAHLQRGIHVRHPGARARLPAARHPWPSGMSAADWRRAMNLQPPRPDAASRPRTIGTSEPRPRRQFTNPVRVRHVLVLAFLVAYPLVATPFFTFQIGAQSLALGLIALSLTFLGGAGGMISLAQMTVAGLAGYMVAIFGTAATNGVTLGWPWWLAVLIAIAIAVLAATFIGWLSARTEGIYTIMITLAIGVAFYYLTLQNYAVFNGFQGEQKVFPPTLGGIYWRDPRPFYYLTLACALIAYLFVVYL